MKLILRYNRSPALLVIVISYKYSYYIILLVFMWFLQAYLFSANRSWQVPDLRETEEECLSKLRPLYLLYLGCSFALSFLLILLACLFVDIWPWSCTGAHILRKLQGFVVSSSKKYMTKSLHIASLVLYPVDFCVKFITTNMRQFSPLNIPMCVVVLALVPSK